MWGMRSYKSIDSVSSQIGTMKNNWSLMVFRIYLQKIEQANSYSSKIMQERACNSSLSEGIVLMLFQKMKVGHKI